MKDYALVKRDLNEIAGRDLKAQSFWGHALIWKQTQSPVPAAETPVYDRKEERKHGK